ncbi:hypothetical protein [Xanthobacter autotrophicus]|uniref:hypothetical protein n=1 Tax=Xanthobacter autotrophicus TaxID=280 RepID=UPI00372C0EB3
MRQLCIALAGLLMSFTGFGAAESWAASSVDPVTRVWVKDLQRVEEMIAAAIQTADAAEIKRQGLIASKLIGIADNSLKSLDMEQRLDCTNAATSLMVITDDLRQTPARALVLVRRDAAEFARTMPKCERAVELKGPRHIKP